MFNFLIGVVVGVILGAFAPSVGRRIKALFVKKTAAAKVAATTEIKKVL